MESSDFCLPTFLDFSKVFDCIPRSILITKLKFYGFDYSSRLVIESYLTNRKQVVQIEDKKSDILPTTFGVPQGSALGPLPF